ncbi:MAG: U32 family peptidase [Candidatus Omnitrophica bacterium]|nr:U32 family peptidase [Candidatus Omnitrophota bacterium]MDD5573564.1 U32 family peptidase [Candidatus Omnitrophota bacterium]
MKKGFVVGYSGRLEDLRRILDSCAQVTSVYTGGLAGKIAGGRPQYADSLESLAPQIEAAHAGNVEFEVALNAPCGLQAKSRTEWWHGIRAYLRDLDAAGVDRVVVSHPFLMDMVRSETDMRITASTICEITTPQAARYYEKLGADVIAVSINVNMVPARLRQIKQALCAARVRILVNEPCLRDCPWRRFHHSHYAHSNEEMDYHAACKKVYLRDPYLLLANTVIRPEDLHFYEGLVDDYKIVGRLVPVEDLISRVRAYAEGRFEGNYIQLFDSPLAALFIVPNRELEGLLEKKWSCDGVCERCLFCSELFARVEKKHTPCPRS